jgi:ubiquinone/menaquinone biosynthesis C-methylase UbiE
VASAHVEVKSANIEFFDAVANRYDEINLRSHHGMGFNIGRILKDISERGSNSYLLDLCCGTGIVSIYAKKYFKHIYGIDVSLNMLKIARGNMNAICGDAILLPFKDEAIDVVTCCGGLHHIYDFLPLFKEAFRVLKKGGYLYIDHEIDKRFMMRYMRLIRLYRALLGVEKNYFKNKNNLDRDRYRLAEYHTYMQTGTDSQEVVKQLYSIGFSNIKIDYHLMGLSVITNYLLSLIKIKLFPRFISPFFLVIAQKL